MTPRLQKVAAGLKKTVAGLSPTSKVLLISLWAPCAWLPFLLLDGGADGGMEREEFIARIWDPDYGLIFFWMPAMWVGAMPLVATSRILLQRAPKLGKFTVLVGVGLNWAVFKISVFVITSNIFATSDFFTPIPEPTPGEVRQHSFGMWFWMSATCLPVLIHLLFTSPRSDDS